MFQWRVEVTSGDPTILTILINHPFLQLPRHTLIEESEHYYLLSDEFESLPTYTEVEPCVNKILSHINNFIKLLFKNHNGLTKVGKSIYTDEFGQQVEIKTIVLSMQARFLLRSDETSLEKAVHQHPKLMEKLFVVKDAMVEEAMSFYMKDTSWINLRKTLEVITIDIRQLNKANQIDNNSDLKKKIDRWTKGTEAYRFWESANNAGISKDEAMHPPSNSTPLPPSFIGMSLDEANDFIRELLMQWIEFK